MREDLDVSDFKLTLEEIGQIEKLAA